MSFRRNDSDPLVLEEEETEAPAATVVTAAVTAVTAAPTAVKQGRETEAKTGGDSAAAASDEDGTGGRSGTAHHGRIIRLGPLVLPVCFFGGGGRA